jgi:hypothetical protein
MRKIVFTGGPSGGKTSIIEILGRELGPVVAAVPEAATILYQGGFPRRHEPEAVKCVQRAIYWAQRELEAVVEKTERARALLCDRGSLDGSAYWPGDGRGFLRSIGSPLKAELARYDLVFHLRTPRGFGYRRGGTRIESQAAAMRIDRKVEAAWRRHPRRYVIEDTPDFLIKVGRVRAILRRELPDLFKDKR